jgi:hypothetical protein
MHYRYVMFLDGALEKGVDDSSSWTHNLAVSWGLAGVEGGGAVAIGASIGCQATAPTSSQHRHCKMVAATCNF